MFHARAVNFQVYHAYSVLLLTLEKLAQINVFKPALQGTLAIRLLDSANFVQLDVICVS